MARVLARHGIHELQHMQGAQTDISKVPDRSGHNVQRTLRIMLASRSRLGCSKCQRKMSAHVETFPVKRTRMQTASSTTKTIGDAAEDQALHFLVAQGMRLLQRNYRTPGRGGGEIDLVMRDSDGTLVFVEVRKRTSAAYGGGAASIGLTKQRRIVFAARHYLMRLGSPPPCRFDVLVVDADQMQWLKAAFDAA